MSVSEIFGSVLSSNPPIAENILKHLNIKSLYSCSCVCKLWNEIAQTIKKSRREMFFTMSASAGECSYASDSSSSSFENMDSFDIGQTFCDTLDDNYSDSKFGIIFCSRKICCVPKGFFFGFKEHEKIWRRKERNMDMSPLTRKSLLPIPGAGISPRYNHKVMEFLSSYLPYPCKVVFCSSEGVIGTERKYAVPNECEDKTRPAITGVFFPEVRGVEFHPFVIEQIVTKNNPQFFKRNGIPYDEQVKCLLIFTCSNPKRGSITSLVTHFLLKQGGNIAIGGAVVDEVGLPCKFSKECSTVTKECSSIGIAITGDNVSASSLILDSSVKTPSDVEEKLKEFKDYVSSEGQHCAYMFACVVRGNSFYNRTNVEADVFSKLFPHIPLFGVFCYGEIGVEHLPGQPNPKCSLGSKWLHSYTTVFVVLSFKT